MFPNGWPGRGLLLLRVVVAVILIHDGVAALIGVPQRESIVLQVIAAIAGVFLLVGLWTPIAGAIIALSETWIAIAGTNAESNRKDSRGSDGHPHLLFVAGKYPRAAELHRMQRNTDIRWHFLLPPG
jgi:uncharacterized membrane protein YphA (DoxX/SURF4 family)